MTRSFPKESFAYPGTWQLVKTKNEPSASFVCPDCGFFGSLLDHQIAEDGTVSPSVDCPDCSFHEHIRLEGWGD